MISNKSQLNSTGRIVVISAPSGTGKSSVCRALVAECNIISMVVSYTTRNCRSKEKNGVDYHFIDQSTFKEMIDSDAFIQYEEIFGNFYGTPKHEFDALLSSGTHILLDIDSRGMQSTKRLFGDTIYSIFLVPPSLKELESRLRKRGRDDEDSIKRRLSSAQMELKEMHKYDYFVVNDNFESCLSTVKAIVESERHKTQYYSTKIPK